MYIVPADTLAGIRGGCFRHALAVICNGQIEIFVLVPEVDKDVFCSGMFQDVIYGFLNYPVNGYFQIAGQPVKDVPSEENAGIPLVGRIAAGLPILATENIEDVFPLPSLLTHGKGADEIYMLRVEGESMVEAGIRNGDILVVNHGSACEDGDIVVARVNGETATVKRLFREPARIRLQPENPLFEPIYVDYDDVALDGKVIGLLRSI